jgi:adenosylcobinamide kinase / adenosylcobinamide-phosphate guanylyltransferase
MQYSITLVTGGARSGKSSYAQQHALALSNVPVYVATAKDWGGDFTERINRHKNDRDARWTNYEAEFEVSKLALQGKVVLVDCVTLWLTNFFTKYKNDVVESLEAFKAEIIALQKIEATFIIVTNEIGMGIHAETEIGRKFTDLQGWANQFVATQANKVVLMVSGIPVTIK